MERVGVGGDAGRHHGDVPVSQSSMSYGREWESVMGYCLCPAEKDEFNTECAALRSKSCKMEGLFFPAKERL